MGVFRFKLSEIKPGNTYLRSTDPYVSDRPISYMDRPFCFFRIDRSLPDRDTCLKII